MLLLKETLEEIQFKKKTYMWFISIIISLNCKRQYISVSLVHFSVQPAHVSSCASVLEKSRHYVIRQYTQKTREFRNISSIKRIKYCSKF